MPSANMEKPFSSHDNIICTVIATTHKLVDDAKQFFCHICLPRMRITQRHQLGLAGLMRFKDVTLSAGVVERL